VEILIQKTFIHIFQRLKKNNKTCFTWICDIYFMWNIERKLCLFKKNEKEKKNEKQRKIEQKW